MDVALALHHLIPGAKYQGSLTDNTKESFDAIAWIDDRVKPSWEDLGAVMIPPPPKSLAEQLTDIIEAQEDILQDQFAPVIAAGEMYIRQGKLQKLKGYISRLVLPENLEPIRQAMLQALKEV